MTARGRIAVIRDPAVAVAASKCWLARWHGGKAAREIMGIPIDSFHPRDCGFCDYPTGRLIEAVTEFKEWAGLQPSMFAGEVTQMQMQLEMFLTLPAREQTRLVRKAQGYEGDDDDDHEVAPRGPLS